MSTVLFLVLLVLFIVIGYQVWFFFWYFKNTSALAYFGLPIEERRKFKKKIRRRNRPVLTVHNIFGRWISKWVFPPTINFNNIAFPKMICSKKSLKKSVEYSPAKNDVFVATLMKSGTTWMQQLVYEIASRGNGDLSEKGHGHLNAMSPWFETGRTVSVKEAPLVGDPPIRIIKTHLPASICPYSEQARYIYVARHPVSCFASIVDFIYLNFGPIAPSIPELTDFFCSSDMWWTPWPKHVDGWWRLAQTRSNVFFVHYEEMNRALPQVLSRISEFLGYQLTEEEKRKVLAKCSFQYMKDNEELFEMAPPNMFSLSGSYFKNGTSERYKDIPKSYRERIVTYCEEVLRNSNYPMEKY